jgi:esterase/lipase
MEPSNEVNKKNTIAIQQELKRLADQAYEQQKRIDGLLATISTLFDRINKLELIIQIQKATMIGHGPSVKE